MRALPAAPGASYFCVRTRRVPTRAVRHLPSWAPWSLLMALYEALVPSSRALSPPAERWGCVKSFKRRTGKVTRS